MKSDMELERSVTISNKYGLHARASTRLAEVAGQFVSEVFIACEAIPEKQVSAKSILGILTLGAEKGQNLRVRIRGEDAEEAMQAIIALFDRGFDEE